MQDNKTNRDKLYTFLTNKGVTGIGADREEFETIFEDEAKQKKLYDFCVNKGYTGIGKNYDEFAGGFSIQKGAHGVAANILEQASGVPYPTPEVDKSQYTFTGEQLGLEKPVVTGRGVRGVDLSDVEMPEIPNYTFNEHGRVLDYKGEKRPDVETRLKDIRENNEALRRMNYGERDVVAGRQNVVKKGDRYYTQAGTYDNYLEASYRADMHDFDTAVKQMTDLYNNRGSKEWRDYYDKRTMGLAGKGLKFDTPEGFIAADKVMGFLNMPEEEAKKSLGEEGYNALKFFAAQMRGFAEIDREAWEDANRLGETDTMLQGFEGIGRGMQYQAGEFANLFSGSSLDDKEIIQNWDRYKELRDDKDPSKLVTFKEAEKLSYINRLVDEFGSIEGAKREIEKRAKDVSWGDRLKMDAAEAINSFKPTAKGFGGFVAEMIPNMAGTILAVAATAITKNPSIGRVIGGLNMTGLSLSTAGNAMKEARDYGANNKQVWAKGIADGLIEFITEKIPFDKATRGLFRAGKKRAGDALIQAVENNPATRKELESLLVRANKELDGKLLNGENVKKFLSNVTAEGLSEAAAEGLQTVTEFIYKDPKDYPGIMEIIGNAFEGAKAGIFMGAVMGGATLSAERRMNNARRKKQGFVDIAQVEIEGIPYIGEVLGRNKNGEYVMLINNEEKTVKKEDIKEGISFSYEEFRNAELGDIISDAYEDGFSQEPTGMNAQNDVSEYEMARRDVIRVLSLVEDADVDEFLKGKSVEDIAMGDADVENAIVNYQQKKARKEGLQERFQQARAKQYEESDRLIDEIANNGVVYSTTINGEQVYITGGTVVLDEQGFIDVNSSNNLFCMMPDGTKKPKSENELREKISMRNAEDLKAAKRAEIDAKWKAEFDTAEAQAIEQEKREAGVVFDMADKQGNHRIEILNEGEQMSDILIDGKQEQIPTEELNRWKQEAGVQSTGSGGHVGLKFKHEGQQIEVLDDGNPLTRVIIDGKETRIGSALLDRWVKESGVQSAETVEPVELPDVPDFFRLGGKNYSVASRNDDGSVDVMVDGKRETLPAGTDYSTSMPTDKKGDIIFTKMPVERTHEYFVQRVTNDRKRAEMIENNRKKAEAERKRFDKEPDAGLDPDKWEAVNRKWEEGKKAAQAKVDYWKEVEKRETAITRSETREAMENIKPEVIKETADEFIANQLSGIKITPESFKRETGLSNAEQAQLVGVISNDGVSVERAAEIILENYDSELAGLGFTGDVQDVRNVIIDILSQGNPRSYARKGLEVREAENMDQQRAEAEVWAKGTFNMTLEELYVYEEILLPRIIREFEGFDETEYYDNLAENYENDTTRESESIGRGGEVLQGEQSVPASGAPVVGQWDEGGAISNDVQGGGQNGVAQEETVNEPVGNSEQLSSSEIPNNQSVAEGDAPGKSGVYADNQGNPVDADGKLIVDEVNSIDEITDEDFETPTRNVQLPTIPENVANAIGTNGRPVVIKKNVFEKNGNTHVELEPEDSRNILRSALYNPNLVGSTQPIRRPDYKVAIRTGEQNAVAVLDVYQEKDFVEIVGWRMVNEKGLAKMQRQAEREGGQFLILSPNDGSAAALSALPLGLSSASEDRNSVSNSQENTQKSGEIAENAPEIQEPRSVEEMLDNGDKRITDYNSRGEVATVATERDGKVVSVDSYDEGVLFEHTEYDGNGKASSVTRYDKQGNVVGTQKYVNGIESKAFVKETMRTTPLRARAEKWMKETGVPVRLIGIGEEITNSAARRAIEAGEKVTGWIDNDEVVLYLPNIRNAKEIDDTFVHEVVAHKGLKALMGKDFDALCDKVWEMMSEEQRAYYLGYPGVNGDTRKAADEYMAHLAEGVDLTDADKTVWQKIVDAVREFLVKHGMKMTDRDIENLIKASYANLRSTEQRAESKESALFRTTYHGSGAQFDRFDHSFMGTGEGAQAFGWGTYVTEVEGIGKQYAEVGNTKLSQLKAKIGNIENALRLLDLEVEKAERELEQTDNETAKERAKYTIENAANRRKALYEEKDAVEKEMGRFGRNLYTVEIPDDNGSNYLHWDEVVPKKVETAVKERLLERLSEGQGEAYKSDLKQELDDVFKYSDFNGSSLYKNISAYLGGDKQASLFLSDMGFVGISYPANATTGGRADGARNYVIFNENDAEIKDRTMFRKKDSERRQEKRRINDIIDTAAGFVTVGGKKQATKNRLKKEAERKQLAKEMYSSVLKGDFNDVTLAQIDKFIEDATPANPFGRRISQRLPQRMERTLRAYKRTNAVDALFSRISESAVPANERFSEAGRREIEERKKELLKGWAIATGNWHTDLKEFTDDTEPIGEGQDSKVYSAKEGPFVIKASKGKPYGKRFRPDIDNIALFNDVFRNSRYEILGYGEIDGDFVRILKQRAVDFSNSTPLAVEERVEYMRSLGFEPINKDNTAFSNGEIVIADLQKSNIVRDVEGDIRVIDADAKLHTKDVGGDYTYPPVEEDLPEDGGTRFRIANENQEIFVSNAQRAVEGIQQNKATAEQWVAMLKKNGGLKAGEDAWLGLEEWLNEKQGAVTKQEILDYIAQNRIQIEEVNYTQFGYGLMDEATRKLEAELKEIGWDTMVEKYPGFDELFEVYNGELLWSEERASVGEYEDFIIDNNIVDLDSQSNAINETREKYTTEGLERKREIALTVPTIEPYNASDEVHFGDAGNGRAVAWVRFGETTDSEGNRVLVIDEIQSKRHQDGREKGYRNLVQQKELYEQASKEFADYASELMRKYVENPNAQWGVFTERIIKANATQSEIDKLQVLSRREASAKRNYQNEMERPPLAPFEKNWHELAMKRMLRLAAEEGFNKVAWTTGEQQAERYNLGAVLKGLKAYKTSANEYYVIPYNNGAIGEFVKEYTEQELADTFGKELAQKIITNAENATEENPYEIESEELRVGGEGMKGFYDKMLPSFVQKYTKKWGAKVGEVTMPYLEENNTMWSVDVTPEMQESVMQGQTMFRFIGEKGAANLDRAEGVINEFNKAHKGATKKVVVSKGKETLEQQMRDAGFTDFSIEVALKNYEGEENPTDGAYYVSSDGIVIYDTKDIDVTLWHENTHRAIRKIFDGDLSELQRVYNELPDGVKEDIANKLKAKKYSEEDFPEESVCYFVEEMYKNGLLDNKYNLVHIVEQIDHRMKDFANFAQKLINYTNNGRKEFAREGEEFTEEFHIKQQLPERNSGSDKNGRGADETERATETYSDGRENTRFRTVEEGTDGSIDDVPTQPLTLMERITNSLLEVSAKNKENLGLRADALKAFGRDINRVLSAMKVQREYDKFTVDTLVKLAKMYFKNAQLLGEVTPYEVARIMGVLNRSVGKRDVSSEATKLMDILLDAHTNALAGILEKAEKVKAKKVNAAGVEVMGRLDKYGQISVDEYRTGKEMTPKKLEEVIYDSDNRLAELEQRVREALGLPEGDVDKAARDYTGDNDVVDVYLNERARLEGLMLARDYKELVQHNLDEIKDLKQELKKAEQDYRLGNIDGESLKEFRKSASEAILQSKAELIEGYHDLIYKFQEGVKKSSQRANAFVQAQIDRAREIQHNANSDMEGIEADSFLISVGS